MSFTPIRSPITAISNANPCVVTTGTNHYLTTGQVVRLHVPQNYGMFQLNQLAVSVSVLSQTTFSIQYYQVPAFANVNSTYFPAFTVPNNPQFTAEVIPIGAGPTPITNTPPQVLNDLAVSELEDAYSNQSTTEIPF